MKNAFGLTMLVPSTVAPKHGATSANVCKLKKIENKTDKLICYFQKGDNIRK